MHPATEEWVRTSAARYVGSPVKVIEFGGRNVNGSNRQHFPGQEYVSIDKVAGPEVDVIGDVLDEAVIAGLEGTADVVVCTNVLEHERRWREVLGQAWRVLKPGGVFIVATVADPFPPHSGIDGETLREGEHYEGIAVDELRDALAEVGFFVTDYRWTREGDSQAVAVRPEELGL